jgi:hypothetical protein
MTIPSRTIGQGLEVQGARYPEALEARTGL